MAVFFADAKRKGLLQVQEAADDVFALFVINWFDFARVVLRLLDFSVKRRGNRR